MSNKEAWIEIPKGEKLPRPDNIPDSLWKLISWCMELKPANRPTFIQVWKWFGKVLTLPCRSWES
jgi:hypothetical protein